MSAVTSAERGEGSLLVVPLKGNMQTLRIDLQTHHVLIFFKCYLIVKCVATESCHNHTYMPNFTGYSGLSNANL